MSSGEIASAESLRSLCKSDAVSTIPRTHSSAEYQLLVLIDESGDPGFKIDRGSTTHFVAAMVIFREFDHAERCSRSIDAARKELGSTHEFHFNKCSAHRRDAFFAAVREHHFGVRALVVDKRKVRSDYLKRNDEKFYGYFVRSLLKYDNGALRNARVKIDGSGDREFKKELSAYLRRSLQQGTIHSIKFAESHRDNLIQLADMVVGAIARSYRPDEERTKSHRWRNMIASKIEDEWEFR